MRPVLRLALVVFLPLGLAAQEPMLPVPPNVVVDGVPPIPMSVVGAVSPYGQFRRARLVAWHPSERRMLISTAFGNATQIHGVRFPGGARTQLTFFLDGIAERPAAVFQPDGRSFVFERDSAGGAETTQLYRYDFLSGKVTMLTDGRSRNISPVVGPKTGLVAYTSTRRDGKNRDLYVIDPLKPAADRLVTQLEGDWVALDWSPDERTLLALEVISSSESYLWRIDVTAGQKTALTPRGGPPTRWVSAQHSRDGRSVFALGNFKSESARIWRHDGHSWTAVGVGEHPVDSFALSPDGKTIAAVMDGGASMRLQLLDPSGRTRSTPTLPPGIIADLAWHPKAQEVAFSLSGARTFSDVYSVNVSNGRSERWTWSESGGANPESLPDAELIGWKSFDGLQISGVLYRPAARFTGPRPVIINVHGGPVARERPRALGRSNYFRHEMGIAIIYPNIRGSGGFGRTFEELDNGRLRANAIKDIGALLDWIAAQPALDKTRVMITGASYGGWVTLASAIEYGDRLRCAQAAFAISDFPSFLESTDLSRQANRNKEYGDPADPEMREFLKGISPVTNAAKLKIPLYLAHGAKDTRVPLAQADLMTNAAKRAKVPLWRLVFQDSGHMTLSPANNDFNQYAWVVFVQKYLLN